jgi:uncharacterized metal-binding protein YceD (DUF177 family)
MDAEYQSEVGFNTNAINYQRGVTLLMGKIKALKLEFSRPLIVDRVPRKGSHEVFAADEAECKALAVRFALPAIHSLKAHLVATPWRGGGLKVTGDFTADLEQVSVVSLEPFRQTYTYEVERYFLPPKIAIDGIEEDAEIIENGEVDLGKLVAENLSLELDPYPRKKGEEFADHEEFETGSENQPKKPSPFASLLKLDKNPK